MNSTFLSDFIMITSFKTVAFIIVLLAVLFGVNVMAKKKVKFSTRMIVSTIVGLILGVIIQVVAGFPNNPGEVQWIAEVSKWYGLVGYGFMVGNLFKLGVSSTIIEGTNEIREITPVVDTLRGLLPSNPVAAMAEGNVVAVVIFAAFIGNSMKILNKKYSDVIQPVTDLVNASYKIITSLAMTVIKFMPYAVVALLANTIAGRGISAIKEVVGFILALYVSIIIVFIIHLIIIAILGLNPIIYVKNAMEPLILAFTSRSSLGTLPVTIEALTDKMGVDNGIASFVGSLGSNMGMNGCAAIYPALMAVTLANMSGTEMDVSFYGMLIVIIVIGSLGIAGLPGSATMAVSVAISGMGMGAYFPLAGGIIAIDPILDMGRTMLNVNGTMVTAVAVGKSFNKVDKEIYNKDK